MKALPVNQGVCIEYVSEGRRVVTPASTGIKGGIGVVLGTFAVNWTDALQTLLLKTAAKFDTRRSQRRYFVTVIVRSAPSPPPADSITQRLTRQT
jgi:hypothetical protein